MSTVATTRTSSCLTDVEGAAIAAAGVTFRDLTDPIDRRRGGHSTRDVLMGHRWTEDVTEAAGVSAKDLARLHAQRRGVSPLARDPLSRLTLAGAYLPV